MRKYSCFRLKSADCFRYRQLKQTAMNNSISEINANLMAYKLPIFSVLNSSFVILNSSFLLICLFIIPPSSVRGQLQFSGSFQSDFQRYTNDNSLIYEQLDSKIASNNYLTLQAQYRKFRAGIRYEAYLPPLLGYPYNLEGRGLVNKFLTYQNEKISATVGNFYEQFGSGMLLRTQEQRFLGMDTSLDGFQLKANPTKNYTVKLIGGKQRLGFKHADGVVVGIDNEFRLSADSAKNQWSAGLSFVNKNEPYSGILTSVKNSVWAIGGRLNFQRNNFNFSTEYVTKSADATPANRYITHRGSGFLLTSNLDLKKVSLSLNLKRIDNFDFRSQRSETLNNALLSYVPATTKQHSYRLLTLYPYASQVLGEVGGQLDIIYAMKKNATLSLNFAALNALNKKDVSTDEGYKSSFFEVGKEKYYRDLNIDFEKKWSKKIKTNMAFVYLNYNKGQIQGTQQEMVKSYTFIFDGTYSWRGKSLKKKALRFELQHLSTKQDKGNWAMSLIEYSISPRYFFYISDEVNYHNFDFKKVKHFPNIGSAFSHKSHRLSLAYGRQREGLLCVGGICRLTPAYTGFSASLTSSF
jgi:Family of unknown function (DUF6029)